MEPREKVSPYRQNNEKIYLKNGKLILYEFKRMSTKEVKNKELYVIAHIGCNVYEDTVEMAKHAEKVGVQGICMMNPTYFKPTNEEHMAWIIH